MSNPSAISPSKEIVPSPAPRPLPARPVSLVTVVLLFVVFAAFLFLVRYYYAPTPVAPQNAAAENLPKDLAWKATRVSRRATLAELKADQAKELETYGWVDQKAGVVRLPIERAMELTVEKYQK
ncbi:MAG TPA: hypothetical protein VHE61_15205 [Opitutaceae bacterium]|nr:hypothetical protein [Opitutaceae bacterium]